GRVMSRHLLLVPFLLVVLLPGRGDTGATPPQPKRFTFRAARAPLSKILEALAQQTGTRVEDARGPGARTIGLDPNNRTFWQPLHPPAEEPGPVVSPSAREGRISLPRPPAGYQRPPTSLDGDFRLTLRGIQARRDLDSRSGSCTVSMEVAWVPGLLPLFLETQ